MPGKELRIITGQVKSYFVDEEDVMELVMAGTGCMAINYLFIVSSDPASLITTSDFLFI